MKAKSSLPARCEMFLGLPVIRLSIAITRCPSASSRSIRCDPRKPAPAPPMQASKPQSASASLPLVDHWTPAPIEFVKLTAGVTLYNSRGKEVKQFSVGKRLRVSKRSGDRITIDYLGDEYTIPTASTE